MKKKLFYQFIAAGLVILFFSGCTQEINLDDLRPEPRLVLNSVAIVGEQITASVSKTWFFTEKNPNITIREAEVSLYVNDDFKEKMTWVSQDSEYNSKGFFQSAYKPVVGDILEIKASVENYKELSSVVSVPPPCTIIDVSTEIIEKNSEYDYYVKRRLKVKFRDEPARRDYYLFLVEEGTPVYDEEKQEYTGEYEWGKAYVEYGDEPLFTSQITPLEKILGYDWLSMRYGRVFSDDLISGKEYTLNVSFSGAYLGSYPNGGDLGELLPNKEHPIKYRIYLYTLAEPYYRYMNSIINMTDQNLHQQLVKAGLAEPVSIYTNINNGIGIVGSCNPSYVEITMNDFID